MPLTRVLSLSYAYDCRLELDCRNNRWTRSPVPYSILTNPICERVIPTAFLRDNITGMRKPHFILACAVLVFSLFAFCAETPDFTVKKIGEGIYAAIGADGGKAGSNAGFVVGSNGVVVIDTFEGMEPARALLAEIRKITKLPIRFVVNTHYHLDHTGGNAVFSEAGATILAHKNLRAWLRTENLKFFRDPKPEQKAMRSEEHTS